MATYEKAAQAEELIRRVAALNNGIVNQLSQAMALRAKLGALVPAEQDIIRQAVRDKGYDDVEIVAILNRIALVDARANEVGLIAVVQP